MTLAGGKVPAPGRRVTGDETTTELVFCQDRNVSNHSWF